jgi:NAD(P)-dependent dehydrogenase (short-subunit alcohol dehydrogenase family)
MYRLALAVLISLVPALIVAGAEPPQASHQRAVLVTGASSGIGRKITERLAADNFFVYAGARKESDLQALGAIRNVQSVRLDVTRPLDIEAAVDTIVRSGRGLYGLVNNAGVATLGSVMNTRQEEFDLVMAVNVAGPYRITRAFAPLIIAEKGRIITIGSISGILAGEDVSAYSMSKHAMEAFTDSLALEMQAFDVEVSVIEPGNYNSDIARNAARRNPADPRVARLADRSRYKEPDEVAAAVALALVEPNPKRRYLVVPNEAEAERTIRKQVSQLVQLNEGHAYTYDRAALIRMLDEALLGSRPRTPQ